MTRTCERCGKDFQARRSTAKYCGSTCRSQASVVRADGGTVVPLTAVAASAVADDEETLTDATRRALTTAGVARTVSGRAALALARRIDAGQDGGSAMASMVKQLEASVSAALASVSRADQLDEVNQRRDKKLRDAGRA